MVRPFALSLAAASLILLATPAEARSPEDRIKALEQQIIALQRTYTSNAADTVSAVESMKSSQDDLNAMKGQVEATSRILQAQRDEMIRLINDLQARITVIEERMGVFSSQVTSAIGKVNPAAGAEASAYQKALDLANGSHYLEAAGAFESFLQKYPRSQWASNARFWVGESFYLSRDYKRAIKEFQLFIEKYPRDAKISEAILKQGNSFYELGLIDESRAFYEKVVSSYPSSKDAKAAKAKLKRIDERRKTGKAPQPGAQDAAPQVSHETVGSPLTSYPGETIEQRRARMSGRTVSPVEQKKPSGDEPVRKRYVPGARDF